MNPFVPAEPSTECAVEGCDRPMAAAGLCTLHYRRRRRGDIDWDRPAPSGAPPAADCTIVGCEKPTHRGGLCRMHYARRQRGADNWDAPESLKQPSQPQCSIEGCERPYLSRGLCKLHYGRRQSGMANWGVPGVLRRGRKPIRRQQGGGMDIMAFLTARLDEDEQLAREAEYSSAGATWFFEGPPSDGKSRPGRLKLGDGPWLVSDPELRAPTFGDNFDGHQMEHIARHDPARVLAEVKAKRRILTDVLDTIRDNEQLLRSDRDIDPDVSEPLLFALAEPYSDHPDYDESWRP